MRRRHSRRPSIDIPNDWACRPHQEDLWDYFNGKDGKDTFHGKRAIVFAHRRWGKDSVAVNLMAVSAMLWPGNYAYLFPLQVQARAALWENFDGARRGKTMDLAFPPEIRKRTDNNSMFVELTNGSTIQLLGSDNYNALMGTNFRGLVFSEWALSDPESWVYLRPILVENGGWALFITTPRGKNHAHRMLEIARTEPHWFHKSRPSMIPELFPMRGWPSKSAKSSSNMGKSKGRLTSNRNFSALSRARSSVRSMPRCPAAPGGRGPYLSVAG